MKQGDLRNSLVTKSIGASCDNSRLVVEALGGTLGEGIARLEPVEEERMMFSQSVRETSEGQEP